MFTGLRLYALIGAAAALALFAGWAFRVDHLRAGWKERAQTWEAEAATVTIALRTASGNGKLQWAGAAAQALALGDEKRQWRAASERQGASIRAMAAETERLKARAAELQRQVAAAQAKRRAALDKLEQLSLTPGERADCETLLREANEALDIAYQAGV